MTGGRPRKPLILTAYERSQAHNAYTRGDRTGLVVVGEREYQRESKRRARERKSA